MSSLATELLALATERGAVAAGIVTAQPFTREQKAIEDRRAAGLGGPLHFTYDDPALASDINTSFPWARSIVVVGHTYLPDAGPPPATGAVVARFAGRDNYQGVRAITAAIAQRLRAAGARAYELIDDNRLLDRAAAARAGVGWVGRSTMVLNPTHGPWMLLGSVATDAELEPTPPMRRTCGTCTSCIPACPTGAIGDRALDSRRCLATWLQSPGSIPQWIRPLLGRRIYGCDDCLTSCPPGDKALLALQGPVREIPFMDLLGLDDDALLERFSWWYIPRRDPRYVRRNILVAAGNSGEAGCVGAITRHLRHTSALIRGHAAWALARSSGARARPHLEGALERERAPEAREELILALLMIDDPAAHALVRMADEWVGTDARALGLAVAGIEDRSRLTLFVASDGTTELSAPAEIAELVTVVDPSTPFPPGLGDLVRVSDPYRLFDDVPRRARGVGR